MVDMTKKVKPLYDRVLVSRSGDTLLMITLLAVFALAVFGLLEGVRGIMAALLRVARAACQADQPQHNNT